MQQSVVVRLRDELGLPELSPLHRLDRITSGVLMLASELEFTDPVDGGARRFESVRRLPLAPEG